MGSKYENPEEYTEKYRFWKKRNLNDTYKIKQSISKVLEEKGKINEEFKYRLSNMKLENIIALKLELMADALDSKMFGFPIWKKSEEIMKDALIKFAMSFTESKREAANFLGMHRKNFYDYLKRFDIEEFFEDY